MIYCNLDDGFTCNSSLIPSKDSALRCFQLEARGALKTGEKRSVKDALVQWKPGQSTLRQLGVKDGSAPLPSKPVCIAKSLLALHTKLASQLGTHFFTTTARATLPDPNTINPALQCDMFEPDPKHRNAMLRSELAPEWIKSEHVEMDGLFHKREALERVLRSSLDGSARVFGSRFHYKIRRNLDMTVDQLKVRLVLQGQHMEQGVDYEHSYSPVPHASGFRTILALATSEDMLIDHVDISQAFLQADMLVEEGFEGEIYITPPPGYGEDDKYVYRLLRPLYGSCTSSRAWHKTMSAFMEKQGFKTVGFEKSMWYRQDANGDKLLVGSHIDDFCIAGSNRACLDKFRLALLNEAEGGFAGTYEGPLHHYLGCAVTRDMQAGTTSLSQAHYIKRVCQKYGQWDVKAPTTPMMPDTRLSIDDCPQGYVDPHFHKQYCGIVGSLGWIVA